MAKIGLSSGFTIIPEGTYVFKIVSVSYKEAFGKLEILMQTQDGQKHTERFSLLKKSGEVNDGALNAFSFFAKTALNDFSLTEIDHSDLVGHFIECTIEHDEVPSNKDPSKTMKFAHITEKAPSDGWTETAAPKKAAPKSRSSLLDMLN